MKSFKQYIKELLGPSHAEPREDGIPNSSKRELADIIDDRSGVLKSIDRQSSPHGVIRNTQPNTNHETPVLDPHLGDHQRGTPRELGSGRMKIHNDGQFPNNMQEAWGKDTLKALGAIKVSQKKKIAEDKKDNTGWVNQYNDADDKRLNKVNKYLFNRSMRKGSKWSHTGVEYGHDDYGPNKELSKRTISVVMTHKDDNRKEVKLRMKPDVEKNPHKYVLKKKVNKNLNE